MTPRERVTLLSSFTPIMIGWNLDPIRIPPVLLTVGVADARDRGPVTALLSSLPSPMPEDPMDDSVVAAMGKWPNVPAVSGWMSLDEQGRWRLRDGPIRHPGFIDFINRNYQPDEQGRWYFQNGPQRVYVALEYTPWILHVDAGDTLRTHTGATVSGLRSGWLDDEGNLLLEFDSGVGLVESGSLPRLGESLLDADGRPLSEQSLERLTAGGGHARLDWGGNRIPVGAIPRAEVPSRFGFVADPEPPASA